MNEPVHSVYTVGRFLVHLHGCTLYAFPAHGHSLLQHGQWIKGNAHILQSKDLYAND